MTENKNLLNYLNTIEPSISETVRKSVCIVDSSYSTYNDSVNMIKDQIDNMVKDQMVDLTNHACKLELVNLEIRQRINFEEGLF
jgi:hypothetical protein